MIKVVFLRHGQSTWNLENRFTGWTDVDLSPQGIVEAEHAGQLLKREGYEFDYGYTSVLKRAIRTLWLVRDAMDCLWLPVHKDWRLNERHYGSLQGLNKAEVSAHYGAEQLHAWRRGFLIRPPALSETDPRRPDHDLRYRDIPGAMLPATESLADTMKRALDCWSELIVPKILEGKRVIVTAHGNTLRALIKHLEMLSDDKIMEIEIPTGVPLVYEFDDGLNLLARYYLEESTAAQAVNA